MRHSRPCERVTGEKAKLSFDAHHFEYPFDFYLVRDFECFLMPVPNAKSKTQQSVGFRVYRVSAQEEFRSTPFKYSGENVIHKFFDSLLRDVPISPLTTTERAEFERRTCCRNCKADFSAQSHKTRRHNHVTGRYLFPACCNCNLALKRRANWVGDNVGDYLVPIVFHNMSAYDGRFVLLFSRKECTEFTTKPGKTVYADVGVIPMNGERNLLLTTGNVVFIDSMQFLAASLDNLVKKMRKSGLDDFTHTTRQFGRNECF